MGSGDEVCASGASSTSASAASGASASAAAVAIDWTQNMPPGSDGHRSLVAKYAEEYPDDHVDGEVALFARKLGRADIVARVETFARPYTRENLLEILEMCSGGEIGYVGW